MNCCFTSAVPPFLFCLTLSNLSVLDEEAFLVAIVSYTNSSTVHFPLSPAYAFYLVGRSLLGGTNDCVHHVAAMTNKMVAMIDTVIEVSDDIWTLCTHL